MRSYANSQRKETKLAKVTVNKYGIIILDGIVDGKRHRLSTGKKADERQLRHYKKSVYDEFFNLYDKKFSNRTITSITFSEYGKMVIDATQGNRNAFSQKEEMQRFTELCKTFGDMSIESIKTSDITRWQSTCGFAPKTILNYRSTLNAILHMAYADDIISKNPLSFVKAPKKTPVKIEVFSLTEIELLIEQSTGTFKNLLLFNFFAGLRGSELIALRWDDIDFENHKITVDTRIRQGDEDVPKSKEIRIIDMLPQAEKALRKQWLLTGLKNEQVFLNQYGKSYRTEQALNKKLKQLCIECDIKPRTLKILRKSCNTLLKQEGMPLDWILDQLGHKEDGVNREHYTGKISPDMSKIGRVLAE